MRLTTVFAHALLDPLNARCDITAPQVNAGARKRQLRTVSNEDAPSRQKVLAVESTQIQAKGTFPVKFVF